MNHQRSVAARFSAAAATYDSHAAVQKEAAERVVGLTAGLTPNRRILEIGCGSGLLTEKLAVLLPEATICAVDISAAMIQMAQARLAGKGGILWIVGDVDSVRNGALFDLVVSSSALHWITPLEPAFKGLAGGLVTGGHLVFSIMIEGTLAELHAARREVAPGKEAQSKLPSENEVVRSLKGADFEIASQERTSSRIQFPSAAAFLKCLHEQGLTGGRFSRAGAQLTRADLRKLVSSYDSNYKDGIGGVYATYEILYVVAKKRV